MSDTYYVVGIHGAPTPETAPHGFGAKRSDGVLFTGWAPAVFTWTSGTQWWPLPPPPTEEAPAPEPVERWQDDFRDGRYCVTGPQGYEVTHDEVMDAADALNALDRDGVCWGPGRPMAELPDDGLVLVQMPSGVPYTFYIRKADYIATHRNTYDCWWPLPGEAQ